MRLTHLLLGLALCACSGDDPAPTIQPKAPIAPTEATPEADADGASAEDAAAVEPSGPRGLAAAQRHEQAISAIESALATDASDDGLWTLLGLEALAAGEAKTLLERLSPDTAIGGRDEAHHRLRAELALVAEQPEQALLSAEKLAAHDAELGAVFKALAIRAGAKADTSTLDPEKAADAIVLAAIQPAAKAAKALSELEVKSWRGRLMRARLMQEAEDLVAARAELAAVLEDADPAAKLAGAQAFAELSDDPVAAAEALAASARAANTLSSGSEAARLTGLAVHAWLNQGRADDALALAEEMFKARREAGDHKGVAQTGVQLTAARLALGQLASARESAAAALAGAEAALGADLGSSDGLTHAAARASAEVALLLGDSEGLSALLDNANPDDKPVIEALALGLSGDPAGALTALGDPQGDDTFVMNAQLAAARFAEASSQSAAPWTARAVKSADGLGRLSHRVEARLEQVRFAQLQQEPADAPLAELSALAAGLGEAGATLAAEVAARRAMQGQASALPKSELGPAVADWAPLVSGASYAALDEAAAGQLDTPESAIGKLGHARALLAAGRFADAYPLYKDALSAVPQHHRGPWAPVSVLAGGAGAGVDTDLALLHGKTDPAAVLCALLLHEWWHGARSVDLALSVGDDPTLSLEAEERAAYYDAHYSLRQQSLRWLTGAGAEPADARAAVAAAEAKALETAGFARALPDALADYVAYQEQLKGAAVLSYRVGPKHGEALVLTKEGGRVVKLSNTAKLLSDAAKLRDALRAGDASGGAPVAPNLGDSLRRQLIDVFSDELAGIGRYLVVADRGLQDYAFNVLPEQQAGLRFLADIRSIGTAPTVAFTLRERPEPPERFASDYLAFRLGKDETGGELRVATEVENVARQFAEEGRRVLKGGDATEEAFTTDVVSARFVHISGASVNADGDLALAEGALSFAELRALDIPAGLVVITGELSSAQRERYAQALLSSGVGAVITTAWATPEATRSAYFYRFFESTIQERAPSRAMFEARSTLQSDENNPHFDPSWWGSFILHGAP